jgi:hypothetical protein
MVKSTVVKSNTLSLVVLLVGIGCTPIPKGECASNAECGEGEACLDGLCSPVDCLTNEECGIKKVCNAQYTCVAGCETDADCIAGEGCNEESGSCERLPCTSTQLDCSYGEICEPTSGECVPAENLSCGECDPDSPSCDGGGACFPSVEVGACDSSLTCPADQGCFIAEYDDSFECSDWLGLPDDSLCPRDWACLSLSGVSGGPYCTRPACFTGQCYSGCDASEGGDACPRGFQCVDAGTGSEVCYGDCAWLTENGYL